MHVRKGACRPHLHTVGCCINSLSKKVSQKDTERAQAVSGTEIKKIKKYIYNCKLGEVLKNELCQGGCMHNMLQNSCTAQGVKKLLQIVMVPCHDQMFVVLLKHKMLKIKTYFLVY